MNQSNEIIFLLTMTRLRRIVAFHVFVCAVAVKERLYGDLSFLAFVSWHTCSIADF